MSEKSSVKNGAGVPFVLESGTYSIPTLVLRDLDIDALDAFIAQQVMRAAGPFDQVPLVIDLSRFAVDNIERVIMGKPEAVIEKMIGDAKLN